MPQMYPMNWLFLFMFFSMMLLIVMILFYFVKKNYFKKTFSFKKLNKNNLNWKW
nr:ATP synthase F0 subunit 8 [Gilpinia sp. 1 GYN-2022c]WEG22867.1 ATP synthase F0 subunit 8 [Gilpinia sp.]